MSVGYRGGVRDRGDRGGRRGWEGMPEVVGKYRRGDVKRGRGKILSLSAFR